MQGRRILLGVTGGIAAYKGPDLVRRLRERGAHALRVRRTASGPRYAILKAAVCGSHLEPFQFKLQRQP